MTPLLSKTNSELGKELTGIDDEVMDAFIRYQWPGNLREFRNVIRRAVLLTSKGNISIKSLHDEIVHPLFLTDQTSINPLAKTKEPGLKDAASKAEYDTIIKVLKEVNNNKSRAADVLKIDRKTLYNKIKTYEDSQL